VVLLVKWSGAAVVNSQASSEGGQQSSVPTTVANGQPLPSTGVTAVQPQLDRQMNGSRFNPDKNRELQKLPLLKGNQLLWLHFYAAFIRPAQTIHCISNINFKAAELLSL